MRELRGLGLSPDLILCRSEKPINHTVKEKISNFCHVAPEQVFVRFINQLFYSFILLINIKKRNKNPFVVWV